MRILLFNSILTCGTLVFVSQSCPLKTIVAFRQKISKYLNTFIHDYLQICTKCNSNVRIQTKTYNSYSVNVWF